MTRFLLLMKSFNLVKCEDGSKTQTRRKRWYNIKKGDEVYYRSNYKTTYKTASGPYIAACDARWEVVRDMSEADCIAEGIKRYPGGWAHKDGEGYDASPQLAFLTLVNECCKERTEMDDRLCRIEWLPK